MREWERYQVERQKDQASISDLYNSLRPPLNHSLISHHHSTIPQTMDSLPRSNLKLYIESYLFSLYTQLQKLISRGFLGREERERRDGFTLNRFELDLLLYWVKLREDQWFLNNESLKCIKGWFLWYRFLGGGDVVRVVDVNERRGVYVDQFWLDITSGNVTRKR